MAQSLCIGVTGGIGSGKSTVAAFLGQLGATVIDADAISRATTAAGGVAIAAIRERFGADFITPKGALDRDRMRQQVFSDPAARQQLEAIVHPLVQQGIAHAIEAARTQGSPCIVLDLPLLAESGHWRQRLDHILVVDCSPETQITRAMQRSQLTRAQVEQIMAAQASRQDRLALAHSVIHNEGLGLSELQAQVQALAPRFGL